MEEKKNPNIYIIEDDEGLLLLVKKALIGLGYSVSGTLRGQDAQKHLQDNHYDLVLLDYRLPDIDTVELIESFQARSNPQQFIIMTGLADTKVAVEMMKRGARDYVVKDPSFLGLLPTVVDRVLKEVQNQEKLDEYEREFHEREIRYRLLAENVADVIWTLDFSGKITFISPSCERLFGYSPEEMMALNLKKLFVSSSYACVKELLETHVDMIRRGKLDIHTTKTFEVEQYRKDGVPVWTELTVSLLVDNSKKILGFLGVTRDISKRKAEQVEKERLQAQFLQSQKMEAVGILAGGISHDFNNLLTTIQGHLDLSAASLNEDSSLLEHINLASKAAMSAGDLTRQLLLFSRKQPMNTSLIDVNSIIENLMKMLQRIIGQNITVKTDLDDSLFAINADQGNLEQVVMNLAINARDAMPSGGILQITTSNKDFLEQDIVDNPQARAGSFVCISVNDTGNGMDEDTIKHIFEPFYTTKEEGCGTGLGMAVVYGIISRHDGWITVDSRPGEGTVFNLYFPTEKQFVKEELVSSKEEGTKGHGEGILVVEDQEEVRELCTTILSSNGYDVFEAENVSDALEIFECNNSKIDMVLSDLILPDNTGVYLVETLLLEKPGLKVLLNSGYSDFKTRFPQIADQGYHFLVKPYKISQMLDAVKNALES